MINQVKLLWEQQAARSIPTNNGSVNINLITLDADVAGVTLSLLDSGIAQSATSSYLARLAHLKNAIQIQRQWLSPAEIAYLDGWLPIIEAITVDLS